MRPRFLFRSSRRTCAAVAVLLIAIATFIPAPTTEAIPVTDTVHTVETILAAIRRYEQLARSVEHQVRNLERLDDWNVREVYGVLAGFARFLNYAESLVYTDLDFLESRWFETFQAFEAIDFSIYPDGGDGLERLRRQRTLETLWGIMRGIRLQANNVSAGQLMLDRIKDQGAGAVGNLDAAQVEILIDAHQAEELAQIRQVLAAQTNVHLVTAAAEQARQAQIAEEVTSWLGLRDELPPIGDFASSPMRSRATQDRRR